MDTYTHVNKEVVLGIIDAHLKKQGISYETAKELQDLAVEIVKIPQEKVRKDTESRVKMIEFLHVKGGLCYCELCQRVVGDHAAFCSWCGSRLVR